MEKTEVYKVKAEQQGSRLDQVLSQAFPEISRSFLQKRIREGGVLVDGDVCDSKKYKVEEGQEITLAIPEPEELEVAAEPIPLDLVYEDGDMLVVNKPRGMVVHPAAGNDTGHAGKRGFIPLRGQSVLHQWCDSARYCPPN